MKSLIEIWAERQRVKDRVNKLSRKEYLRMSRSVRRSLKMKIAKAAN